MWWTESICIQKDGLHVSTVSVSTKNVSAIWKELYPKTLLLLEKLPFKKNLGGMTNYSIVERYFGIWQHSGKNHIYILQRSNYAVLYRFWNTVL